MKKQKILTLIFVSLWLWPGLFFSGCTRTGETQVADLRCEYLKDPVGLDVSQPRFSWIILSDRRGMHQTAYRILVADNKETLQKGDGNMWDGGWVTSDDQTHIVYEGKPLESDHTYYWNVCVRDEDGKESRVSEPARFHTGLLHARDWEGPWVGAGDTAIASPLLRKSFILAKAVKSAYVHITGLGNYELYMNGKKIGDHFQDPTLTDFRKRVLYTSWDVTGLLKKGENVAGVWLGNGAYRLKKVAGRYSWGDGGRFSNTLPFRVQMNILFNDGSRQQIVSDTSWRYAASPVVFNNFYGGEDYDARREQPGWSSPGFDASGWRQVSVVKGPSGVLRAQLLPPVRVIRTLQPVAMLHPAPGVYLFDLGQNIPGWWRLRVSGAAGVTLRVRGAETLNDSLFPKPLEAGDRLSEKYNYHAEVWTDYTLRGEGTEVWEPRFFYTGYRYLEVKVDNPSGLDSLSIEGRAAHTALEPNGRFVSSDTLLNRIHRATVWAQIANTYHYPTDCPHREKGAYTGDGQVVAEASLHDFRMGAFYTNWLQDMRDAQEENGRIPNTAPELVGGMGGGVAWGSAYILIPWWMYQYYDDTRVLKEHYPTMKRYVEYLRRLARTDAHPEEPYIINFFGGYWYCLGEWCAPDERDGPNHAVVSTVYYFLDAKLLSRIAEVLGWEEDARRYRALADTVREALNKRFFNPATVLYGTDSTYQTYQLLALAAGVVPEEMRGKVFHTITEDILRRDGHLNTGIIGTKYLWHILPRYGRSDLAQTIINQHSFPGYGYWIDNGATTLWEEWSGVHSHNHQMFGSVDEFLYKHLAGIHSPEEEGTTRGYRHICIQPYIPESLRYVKASVNTVAGKVVSEWDHSGDTLHLQVEIPANSDATISIPLVGLKEEVLTEKGRTIWKEGTFVGGVTGINDVSRKEDHLTIKTGSGLYDLQLTGKKHKK